MGLNMKKLREMQKEIKTKSEGGGNLFLYSSQLPEELDVRILPPKANMNGIYFIEEEGWWVNGKFILVDKNDVIKAEVEKAKKSGVEDLIALIGKKNNGIPAVKRQVRYLIPILTLNTEYDEDTDEMENCEVESQNVLVAKPTLMREINRVVTARPFQNKTEFGIADRKQGYNIIIGKQGKGLDTQYTAMGWNEPSEIEAKWYEELPDILEIHKKSLKSEEHCRSVIRNYLYGDEIIEDSDKETADEPKKETPKRERQARPLKKKEVEEEEYFEETEPLEEEEVQPQKSKSSEPKKARSILEDAAADMEDMD